MNIKIFQNIGSKIYHNNNFYSNIESDMNITWKYKNIYKDRNDIKYMNLYTLGKDIDMYIPDKHIASYQNLKNNVIANMRSFYEVGANFTDLSKYLEYLPSNTLMPFLQIREEALLNIYQTIKRPINYDFYLALEKVLADILKYKIFYVGSESYKNYVNYKQFGTRTYRLKTTKSSFPILSYPRNLRHLIKPRNDMFLELDFNAFECRVLLAATHKQQPISDLHLFHEKILRTPRKEAKNLVYSWLYDFMSDKPQGQILGQIYERETILNLFWHGQEIENLFQEYIQVYDKNQAFNNWVQSSASGIFLRQVVKIHELLKNMKSKIAFLLHDAIVIDLTDFERNRIKDIVHVFENTCFGHFKANTDLRSHL